MHNVTKMERRDCDFKIDISGESQRNFKGLLTEMTDSQNQARSIEILMSEKGVPARKTFRAQLVQLMLSKLKKISSLSVEDKPSEGNEEAVLSRNIYGYEETLWYRLHYDQLAKAKKMKKPQLWSNKEASSIGSFLQDGMDFYLSLLEDLANSSCLRTGPVRHIVMRCFMCLGDLARYYCTDLPSASPSPLRYCVPGLYYMQALELSPKTGLTHSNLAAVLCNVDHKVCSSVLQYLAALLCQHQQARVLVTPMLESSTRHYEALLDENWMLVLGSDSPAISFPHTLVAVVRAFLVSSCHPDQLQIVCRNFLLHFDKLLKEIYSSGALLPQGEPQSEALVVQSSLLLGVTYYLQKDAREKTCAVLLASVLLSLLTYLTQACRRALCTCCPPAVVAALARPARPLTASRNSPTTSCSDVSSEPPAVAAGGSAMDTAAKASARSHTSTRRTPRRRRRLRRCPQDREESSCEEDGVESDTSEASASVQLSDALCSSSDDDDEEADGYDSPDVIIESDSENETASSASVQIAKKVSNLGISTTNRSNTPIGGLSALKHLLLLSQLDSDGGIQCKSSDLHGIAGLESKVKPAPGLLMSAKLVTSWLLSASTAKGDIVWCSESVAATEQSGHASTTNTPSPDANGQRAGDETKPNVSRNSGHLSGPQPGQGNGAAKQGVEIMWAALAEFCNLVSVDLELLCSEEYCHELPNLTHFLKSVAAAGAFSVDSWAELDDFTLPEDDLLRSAMPDVAEQARKGTPRALVGFLLEPLQKLGIMKVKDHVLLALDGNSAAGKSETSRLLPHSCLKDAEITLLRTMRFRKTVFQLTQLAGCPLEYDPRSQAFYFASDSETAPFPQNDLQSNFCEEDVPEGFYYYADNAPNGARYRYGKRASTVSRPTQGRRSRSRPNRSQDDRKFAKKYKHGRPRRRGKYSNYEGSRKSPLEEEQGLTQSDLDHSVSRSGVRTTGKSYRQDRAGRRTPEPVGDNVSGLKKHTQSGDPSTSRSASSDGRVSNPKTQNSALAAHHNSPSFSSDNRNTSAGFRQQGFSKEPRPVSRGTPSPSADEQLNGGREANGAGSGERGSSPAHSAASEEERTRKRQADQQLLTERWLRHELSKTSVSHRGSASPTERFTYIVPDALALSYYRPTLTALLKLENAVVVPLEVMSHLDDLKRRTGAARDASRWLEHQVRRTLPGGRLRLQRAAEHCRVPGVQYPGRQHKMPWRWYQILECCHHFARLHYMPPKKGSRPLGSLYSDHIENSNSSRPGTPKLSSRSDEDDPESLSDRKPVIMLITGETRDAIGKLPFSLETLTASVGTEMHFAGEMQKTLPHPPRRGRT